VSPPAGSGCPEVSAFSGTGRLRRFRPVVDGAGAGQGRRLSCWLGKPAEELRPWGSPKCLVSPEAQRFAGPDQASETATCLIRPRSLVRDGQAMVLCARCQVD